MSFWSSVSGLQNEINLRTDNLDERIERLEQAKSQIQTEQDTVLEEIKELKKPDLQNSWVGDRANQFEEQREDVYQVMLSIGNHSYDLYQSTIQSKINSLELQRSGLSALNNIANEVNRLLDFGEDVYDEVSSKISHIRRELFF
ncbi:DUF5082 family protein [Amphibacillus cookii]|uniref:DUF5082 family protein n=1 Tax=Amphibacillus cookii TaxID=767787 RepID=UPI00195AECA1|nr:DUF5082 family protein [Amphibacillus cookii]MBM7542018.1 uncharacterized protein YukE [Amphibacillus cookii]